MTREILHSCSELDLLVRCEGFSASVTETEIEWVIWEGLNKRADFGSQGVRWANI